jgi:putative ABC transport system substrate-binding protein
MRRREFVSLFGGAVAAWPLAARAQQPSRLPTIGLLGAATASAWRANVAAFVQWLSELGWADSRTIAIVYRWANGRPERFTEIAAEFVQRKVDVIVTAGTAVGAAKQATSVIPIVFQRPRSRSAPASSQVLRVRAGMSQAYRCSRPS